MPHVSDDKNAAVGGGNTDTSEQAWLKTQGATSDQVNDAWLEVFALTLLGAATGNFNTDAYAYLGGLGHTGALPDRWASFWAGGGGGLGAELVTNGGFDTDTDWFKGSGWQISLVADTDGQLGDLAQVLAITEGKTYRISLDITQQTSAVGGLRIRLGSGGDQWEFHSVGAHTVDIVAGNDAQKRLELWVSPANSFIGEIDNVSVKEVL